MHLKKNILAVLLLGLPNMLHADALSAAASIMRPARVQELPKAETKQEFLKRLNNAFRRSQLVRASGDNQPYQDVEQVLKADWKSGFIEKNPGTFAFLLVGGIAATTVAVIYVCAPAIAFTYAWARGLGDA